MRGIGTFYEVCVETGERVSRHQVYRRGETDRKKDILREKIKNEKRLKTVHVEASRKKQAEVKGRKHGRVISVRKVDFTKIFGNIENLDLKQPPLIEYVENSPYTTAIAMDEMVWQKRNKRIRNRGKDENRLDK